MKRTSFSKPENIRQEQHMRAALLLLVAVAAGSPLMARASCEEPPDVTLTSPTTGTSVTAPATVTLTASLVGPLCSGRTVTFKANGTALNVDTAAPWTYTWTNAAPGTYSLTAVSSDSSGISTSAPVTLTVNTPISISLTSPSNGAVVLAPASFTLNASASDSTGTITKVEFYANGALINTDTAAPYSFVYSGVAAGSYTLTAKATDDHGISTTSAGINVVSNAAPSVSLTSPANGATGLAPATFTVSANASDSDGSIAKVEFYANGSLINTDTSAPYSYAHGNLGSGSYAYTAKAYDNRGAVTTSAAVSTSVNAPPTVSMTAPANGMNTAGPTSVTLTATAADGDGTISKVEFYSNGGLINTDTVAPYSFTNTFAVGNYALTAKTYDNLNAVTTSSTVNITILTNGAPTVSLTAPANGATAVAPANFTLNATANDADGSVGKVEFYTNGALISTDTTSPYSAALGNLTPGSYVLTAKATDNLGLTTTSTAATVTISGVGTQSVTRTYVYDANERLCKTISPESGATIVDYDAAGNLAWSVDGSGLTSATCDRASVPASAKTTRTYDALNRVRLVATPGALADLSTTYTLDGKVASLAANNPNAGSVLTQYSYNKRRMLISESVSQTTPSMLYTVGYGYNGNGHLTSLSYPDNQVVSYAPNGLGQPTQVGAYVSAISYYANGAIAQFTYGNGVVHTMTQNARQLPTRSRDVVGATVVLDDTYAFDKNGNVTDITDQAQGGLTTRGMGYDNRDRLTAAVAPGLWGNAAYAYDGFDNLTRADQGVRNYRYSYANQRLTQINDANGISQYTFGYDAAGNITIKNNQAYVFDSANRLNQVTGLQSYRYDGQGRRVQTTDQDGKTTLWQYSQAGQVLYTSEARKSRNTDYFYLGNTQIAARHMAWGSGAITVEYQHTDALGSLVAETSAAGAVIHRNNYAPYGEAFDSAIDGPGYTGHVMDAATGLTYMQQRYYDPQIGRFLSVDPVTASSNDGSNFNRYWYANNNPFKFTDPDGRFAGNPNDLPRPFGDSCSLSWCKQGQHFGFQVGGGKEGAGATKKRKLDSGSLTKGKAGARGEATGIQLLYRMRRYVDPKNIAQVINSHTDGEWGNSDARFVYTREVGWIDLKHVAVSGSIPIGAAVGEVWEWGQSWANGGKYSFSSGAAEDANSNVIGANARIWQTGSPRPAGMTSNFGNNVQVLVRTLSPVDHGTAQQILGTK